MYQPRELQVRIIDEAVVCQDKRQKSNGQTGLEPGRHEPGSWSDPV
jgi:hypothetical protein